MAEDTEDHIAPTQPIGDVLDTEGNPEPPGPLLSDITHDFKPPPGQKGQGLVPDLFLDGKRQPPGPSFAQIDAARNKNDKASGT
jgi:hypothetical protein